VVFVSDLAQSHRRAPVSGQFVTVRTKIQGPAGLAGCAMASRSTCSSFQFQPSNCAGRNFVLRPTRPLTTGPLVASEKKTWATCQASLAPSTRVPSTDPMSAAVRSGLYFRSLLSSSLGQERLGVLTFSGWPGLRVEPEPEPERWRRPGTGGVERSETHKPSMTHASEPEPAS